MKNHFPSSVIFNSELSYGKVAQCHFFVPEASKPMAGHYDQKVSVYLVVMPQVHGGDGNPEAIC